MKNQKHIDSYIHNRYPKYDFENPENNTDNLYASYIDLHQRYDDLFFTNFCLGY